MAATRYGSGVKASVALPAIYRFLLLNIEPFFACAGVLTVLLNASGYVGGLTREAMNSVDPRTQFIYTELAGGWLHFAFVEAVVLRLIDDLRTWRLLAVGMLLSDMAYCHSCAQAVGGWGEWIVLSHWTAQDWVVTITTWPFVLIRCAIVLGIGVRDPAAIKQA